MVFLIQQTINYAVPLLIVALAGVFAERSGIINLALEGIMVFGAFVGALFIRIMQSSGLFDKSQGQWLLLLTMLVCAIMGAIFSLLLSFSAINLKADQTIGGTALNLLAPALVLFLINVIAQQNKLVIDGGATTWFMIKKSTFGIPKSQDIGFLGELLINKVYLSTYVCILLFIVLSILLYTTKILRRRHRSASMSTRCAMRARPSRARCPASAALSMRSRRQTARRPVRSRASASLPSRS